MNPVTLVYIKKNGGDGTSCSLTARSQTFVGRDKECDLRIQLPLVANKQMKIELDESGNAYISNLHKENAVLLNEKPVTAKTLVPDKGIISISNARFRLDFNPSYQCLPEDIIENKENTTSDMKVSLVKVDTPIPNRKRSLCVANSPKLQSILEKKEEEVLMAEKNRVSFGPLLSPEYYNTNLPANTPIKKGSLPSRDSTPLSAVRLSAKRRSRSSLKIPSLADMIEEEEEEEEREENDDVSLPARKIIKLNTSKEEIRKKLTTPVRKEIESKPSLRKTKKVMATPIRKEIESKPSLRKTKKAMATPIRKAIESKPSLHKTKKAMATPIRKEIESKPSLRKTIKFQWLLQFVKK
jgi:hypothetical protein